MSPVYRPHILIVDDSRTAIMCTRFAINRENRSRRSLGLQDWVVGTATTKAEALELAAAAPDIVLLDIELTYSRVNAELVRELRNLGCKMVILASASDEIRETAAAVLADGVVHKGPTGESALVKLLMDYR